MRKPECANPNVPTETLCIESVRPEHLPPRTAIDRVSAVPRPSSAIAVFVSLALCGAVVADEAARSEPIVSYEIHDAARVPAPLTGAPLDLLLGLSVYYTEGEHGCVRCHGALGAEDAVRRHGAPALPSATRDPAVLRLWLTAPQVIAPGTRMPSFYAAGQRINPDDPRFGEPFLSPSEIESVIGVIAGF